MAVYSLAEVLIIIILVVPGFISFFLINWIALIERKHTSFEITVWSLALSVVIYAIFSSFADIGNFDDLREKIFSASYIVPLMILAVAIGVFIGELFRCVGWRGVRKISGSCWDRAFEKVGKKGGYLIVYTRNGLEYKGELHYSGIGIGPRDLTLRNPKLIIRDKNLKVLDEIEMGREILFTEKDVQRVTFFEDIE